MQKKNLSIWNWLSIFFTIEVFFSLTRGNLYDTITKNKKALEENVIHKLLAEGFVGKYPDYRKIYPARIELISFPKYKYGNAFYVLASVAYPNRIQSEQNINYNFFNGNLNDLTADDCGDKRYYLKGNFGDLFYYTDVYLCGDLGVMGISEEKAKTISANGMNCDFKRRTKAYMGKCAIW